MKANHEVIQGYTPAPWRWEFNEKSKCIQICGGIPKYDLIVMDFVRYGMNGAQPRFNMLHENGMQVMENASKMGCVVEGREHHQSWFKSISHPDALLMIKAPEMLEMLKKVLEVHDHHGFNGHLINDQIKELIKLATTI